MDKKSELIKGLHGHGLLTDEELADFIIERERKLLEEIENALKLPETAFRVRNNEALRIIEERKA